MDGLPRQMLNTMGPQRTTSPFPERYGGLPRVTAVHWAVTAMRRGPPRRHHKTVGTLHIHLVFTQRRAVSSQHANLVSLFRACDSSLQSPGD